jgi:uncharacterized protein DUF4154
MMSVRLSERHQYGSGYRRIPVEGYPRRIGRAGFATIFAFLWSCAFPDAFPQNGGNGEYRVKLAFLYNFAKFVEWPPSSYPSPGAPLTICIIGLDPFSPDIEAEVRARSVLGRPVEILTVKPTKTLRSCHMVFIPVTERDRSGEIVKDLNGSSTLTVGEAAGFAMMGGIINLTVEGSNVHFEINRSAADRAGLKISSKLLSLAKIFSE